MRLNDSPPPVTATAAPPASLDVDVLVIGAFEDTGPVPVPGIDEVTRGHLERAAALGELSGKPFSVYLAPAVTSEAWRPRRVMATGLGPRPACSRDAVRRWAATSASVARERRLTRAAFLLPGVLPRSDEAQAAAEGVTLAGFHPGSYKTDAAAIPPALVPGVVALMEAGALALDDFERATAKGYILGACSNLARTLANEPANGMTPRLFADAAGRVAAAAGLAIDVLDEDRLAGLGMGLLLAVARGSAEPPRLVVLRYEPPKRASGTVLGLVGKGVTFDSGGLSIKTAEGMQRMKSDMSGGAAVLGAMKAIAALRPSVPVVGIIPLVENMPGGRALRPGDVVRGAGGRTVEVLDTDAEGRLILADALWYAGRLGATHLVDVATLTGACAVALGRTISGVFGSPPAWAETVRRTADLAGDRSWVMPVHDDLKEQLKSEIADMANIGSRYGGAITAAVFLKEFSGGLPWAHMDIAGTAWADEAQPYQPKGPTGVAVRTLAELALGSADWNSDPEDAPGRSQ